MENNKNKIKDLLKAIDAQESLRASLGDGVVDATLVLLRDSLAALQSTSSDERKLITCLFCDVVGSTKIASERDPEEVLNIIDGALKEMNTSIDRYGGGVARFMGDGILALFGAPKALERHAEQAIRAGLDIQSRINEYAVVVEKKYGLRDFKVRIGINSGHVIAGQVAGAKGEYTVIGDPVNIASRIESAAPPGGVLVGESAFRLAGGEDLFVIESWEPIKVKGAAKPVQVYQILDTTGRAIAKPNSKITKKTPYTGRDAELNSLKTRFQNVRKNRQSQIVTVIGPAGIGKSRLRLEFAEWVEREFPSAQVWLGRTLSYEANTPYRIIADLLRRMLGIVESDNAEERRSKLESGWSAHKELTKTDLQGLAAILALEYPEDSLAGMKTESKRKAIFNAFTAFCDQQAAQGELALIFEDTHWADEISLELIEHLFEALAEKSVFFLLLTRPVNDSGAKVNEIRERIQGERYTEVFLSDLTAEQSANMTQAFLKDTNIPEWLTSTIMDRAQGNPFFIEELINTLIENGTLKLKNGKWETTVEAAQIHVPETIQGVLAARIDRLSPSQKQVIQHAAIIGRIFWQELLTDLVNDNVDDQLLSLANQEFIEEHGGQSIVEDVDWMFRHVLVQEVAYESVLKQMRRKVHQQIAEWLEEKGGDRLVELAPTLARHYEQAEIWDEAIDHLSQAGDRSAGLYALHEAINFYNQAVELAELHPKEVDQNVLLRLLEKRGGAYGMAAIFEESFSDLERVLGAARQNGDEDKERDLLINLGMIHRRAENYDEGMQYLDNALQVARNKGDMPAVADALYHIGSVLWSEGKNSQSATCHQEALEISRELGLTDLVAVQATHGRAESYWMSGEPDKAMELFAESLSLARLIGDKSYEAENLQMMSATGSDVGIANYKVGIENGEEALTICRSAGFEWHEITSLISLEMCYMDSGDYQKSMDILNENQILIESKGSQLFLSKVLDDKGRLYQHLNLIDKAIEMHTLGIEAALNVNSTLFFPSIQANLAIDHIRQGDLSVGPQLLETLENTLKSGQELYSIRCLEGLAELSLRLGDFEESINYASKMLDMAKKGGMQENIVQGHRWMGEAYVLKNEFESAEKELTRALRLAEKIGSVRSKWDINAAFVNLYKKLDDEKKMKKHQEIVRNIVQNIDDNLKDDELKVGLPKH